MKTAIVHDWLVSIAGGEKALESIYEIFPSKIHTLVMNKHKMKNTVFAKADVKTSFLQKFPLGVKKYQSFLPFFPMAVEQFDLSEYDLIISTSSCVARGALTHGNQMHICYCFTPMRYAWDLYQQYLRESRLKGGLKGILAKIFLHYLRLWDYSSQHRVDEFVAISHFVAKRIQKTYGREAAVIYPPVDTEYFSLCTSKDDYYVTASRMVPYKKIDLIVEAFAEMPDKKLIVIGDGPEKKKIRAKAKDNVVFLGHVSDTVLKEHVQRAKAFVFAALEDFGIAPIEAMSTGTPVIAFGKGGVKETVEEGETGIFFHEQAKDELMKAVEKFEKISFDPLRIRSQAEKFSKKRFKEEFQAFVEKKTSAFLGGQ